MLIIYSFRVLILNKLIFNCNNFFSPGKYFDFQNTIGFLCRHVTIKAFDHFHLTTISDWHPVCLLKGVKKINSYVFPLRTGRGLGTKGNYILDLRETIPPITLLKISQAFRDMKPGEMLEILCRDLDTRRDVFKVISPVTCELIVMEEMADEPASVRVQMKKK